MNICRTRTAAGKARISLNAITHGISSTRHIVPGESTTAWAAHRAAMIDALAPVEPVETAPAERADQQNSYSNPIMNPARPGLAIHNPIEIVSHGESEKYKTISGSRNLRSLRYQRQPGGSSSRDVPRQFGLRRTSSDSRWTFHGSGAQSRLVVLDGYCGVARETGSDLCSVAGHLGYST